MQTAFEQPQFSELTPNHLLGRLFHRMGDASPKHVTADGVSGAGSHALGIWILAAVSAGDDLPFNERYKHSFYRLAVNLPGTVLVLIGNPRSLKTRVLDFTTSPGRGLTVKAYDVVGWGRSKSGKVGPVVDAINAPSACIQRADVVEWFELGDDA